MIKVQFVQEYDNTGTVGCFETQVRIYKVLTALLHTFKQFYVEGDKVTMTVIQHFCKNIERGREQSNKGLLSDMIKHLSAARHFCVVIPHGYSDEQFIKKLQQYALRILEIASQNPRVLPTSHCYDRPVENENGAPTKQTETITLTLAGKRKQPVDFATELARNESLVHIHEDTKLYIEFLHNFAVELKNANYAIDKYVLKSLESHIFTLLKKDTADYIQKLPPYDVIEAVQHLCLSHFDHRQRDAYIGRQLWFATEALHTRISKNAVCNEPIADQYSLWYICDTIVLLLQLEYKIKYQTEFWASYQYQQIDLEAVEYLLQSELRVFNREWNMSIANYKPIMRSIINA